MLEDCRNISVLKKNETVVPFDGDKIKSAIRKSAERVNVRLTPEQETFVVSYVSNLCPENAPIQVKTLHTYVELALDSVNIDVARSYREYRNYKTQFVKMLDQVYRKKLELNNVRDASNANADSELVTTQKAIAYAELNGELYKRFFLTDEENKAQEDGYIYIHDKGARLDTSNCMLCDVKEIFKGGFRMGNVQYREPKTVGTAISLMVDIILNAGACQYGGFTVSEIDKLLAPYAKTSYDRYYAEYEDILGRKDQMGATLYATKKLNKELEDGAIECEMRLNSATTARGDFVFSSLSFGLSDDRFGQMVSSAFLKVRRTGAGTSDHIPVLFPKLTFMYDENKHGAGKEQEWLFLEAVECTKRAQYPDFLSMTGDGYAPSIYKKYGVTISRMGCVDGKSQVIYHDVYGDIHECCIEEMWEHLSKCFPVLSQESLGYSSGVYIDLHGVRIFDKDGFVNCSRIIKNTQNPRWCRVMLAGGKKLVCTADHPWTTWFSNVSHVKQTKDLVPGDVVEVFFGLPSYTEQNDVVKESVSVQLVEISSIEIMDKVDVSYDVTTESEHFFCSGVRSHNCRANLSPWYERGGIAPADDLYEIEYDDGTKEIVQKGFLIGDQKVEDMV